MTLTLTAEEQAVAKGSDGAAIAMRIVAETGRILGAERLIPIESAHIDGALYHGDSGTLFAEKLVEAGAMVAVPATLNVGALDLLGCSRVRLEGEKRAAASSLVEARTSYEVVGPTDLEAGHLLAICHHAGVRVRRVVPLAETLEDVFLRLLGDDLEPEPEPPQQELEDEGPVAEHAADDTYPGNGSGAA